METLNQKDQIINSLKDITRILKQCNANYRILGSILLVAHIGKIFRTIHDIDMLLDKYSKESVFKSLQENGFKLIPHNKVGFRYVEAQKAGFLTLTFMLVGDFTPKYFTWCFMKIMELRIRNEYLKPTVYTFEGVEFIGIPISSAIAGIRMSFLNPKRKKDREVLGADFFKSKVKLYNNIIVYILGIKLPFVYDIFSYLYNIYGGIRVIFGRKYEIWN